MFSIACMKRKGKELIRAGVPLSVRKSLCILLNRQRWISSNSKYWWTQELLKDYEAQSRNDYHRFLWTHHLAYAATYDVESRFGEAKLPESRSMFFSDLRNVLLGLGVDPASQIHSVFEVGCSLGYQLRYLETELFPQATVLAGIDIDRRAIDEGNSYLRRIGSKVQLQAADMGDLQAVLRGKLFDVIICTGVLMYLDTQEASAVVSEMLQHCSGVLGLSGPAYPVRHNRGLEQSVLREEDGSFIHNLDSLVEASGGRVIASRWEGDQVCGGHTIYFVFAERPGAHG